MAVSPTKYYHGVGGYTNGYTNGFGSGGLLGSGVLASAPSAGNASSYGYTPVGRASKEKVSADAHRNSMFILGFGLFLTCAMLLIGFCYIWYSRTIPDSCPVAMEAYFLASGVSNVVLAFLIAVGTYLMKGMLLSSSHAALAERFEEEAQPFSIQGGDRHNERVSQKYEFEENALHYGGGMTTVLMLQGMIMLFQCGLGVYGIVQVVQASRDDTAYLCGNAIVVFWIITALHFLQNCCNLGKSYKGCRHHPKADRDQGGVGSESE